MENLLKAKVSSLAGPPHRLQKESDPLNQTKLLFPLIFISLEDDSSIVIPPQPTGPGEIMSGGEGEPVEADVPAEDEAVSPQGTHVTGTQTVTHEYLTLNGKVARETIRTNNTLTAVLDFIYDESGKPFALKYSTNGTSFETYYYVLNLQGDVVKLIHYIPGFEYESVATYEYDAWGNVSSSGRLAEINPLRYRGYYYDNETGFYYLQSRYYDPANRRFINADSYISTNSIDMISYNMFAYCGNNPVIHFDPSGHFLEELLNHFTEALQNVSGIFAFAGGVSQLDSPAPGPADAVAAIIAGATAIGCGIYALGEAVCSSSNSGILDSELPLSSIAAQYGLYECKEAALAMAKQNGKGYLIRLDYPDAVRGYVLAPESKYGWGTPISQNGSHWGYCDQQHLVRCNVFPSGLPENEWIRAFTDAWGSEPVVTRIPLP